MNNEIAEELYDKWNEWAVYLSNYAVVNLNEKAERIYNDYKTGKPYSQETIKYVNVLYANNGSKNLKADLYHHFLDEQSSYDDCLSFMNAWGVIEKVEFLEFYMDQYVDEDNKDTALNKAVKANLNQTKIMHGII